MTYTPEDSWQEFETTGSVAAYLAYRQKSNNSPEPVEEPALPQGDITEQP